MSGLQAVHTGRATCTTCGMLGSPASGPSCKRCGTLLHFRKPNSIQRTWAYLIAAYVLYLPANLLPITVTRSIFGTQQDTILSGVVYLWHSGSWPIALVVFVASIVVPLLKLFSLTLLVVSVQRRWRWDPLRRTKLYRFLEVIGRWSMLDVYVVTILVALVQAESLATISPGSGVLAFAAVVVLSMLATMAFEPRLIWDPVGEVLQKENEK
jgi:paraquat-inducible protein A